MARFPNPKAVLLPGMTGRVRFTVGTRKGVVLVPEAALFDMKGSKAVRTVEAGSPPAIRTVTVDGSYRGKSVVTKGLAGGERVIVPARTAP